MADIGKMEGQKAKETGTVGGAQNRIRGEKIDTACGPGCVGGGRRPNFTLPSPFSICIFGFLGGEGVLLYP